MRWSYKVFTQAEVKKECERMAGDLEDFLNDLGQDGWELVAMDDTEIVMKRPTQSDKSQIISRQDARKAATAAMSKPKTTQGFRRERDSASEAQAVKDMDQAITKTQPAQPQPVKAQANGHKTDKTSKAGKAANKKKELAGTSK